MITRRPLLAAAAASLAAPAVHAQPAWPSGPIRIVVPFPPGGSTDAMARLLQPRLQAELGQPIVVENRGGASGSLGAAAVARSAPDGNTWLLVFDTHAVNQALIPNMGFDTLRDLTHVMLFGTAPMVFTAHRSRPWRDMRAAIAAAKARPDTLTYGTIGNGSIAHLSMMLAQKAGDFTMVHVPYRGGGPLAIAAVAGEVDFPFATRPALGTPIENGAVFPLAQTGARRSPTMPDVPTFQESGMPGIDTHAFWGFLGPANLPAPIVRRMDAALRGALAVPEVRDRVIGLGIDLDPQDGPAFARFVAQQMELWARVIRENNIRPD